MKRLGMLLGVVAVCGFVLMAPSVFADGKKGDGHKHDGHEHKEGHGHKHAEGEASPEAMHEMMMKMATPGPQHAMLKEAVGTWNTETKHWMGPGEPSVSKGVAVFTMLMGDRYLQEDFTSSFGGMEFKGRGIYGFDNAKQKYTSAWCDNMSTGLMTMVGTYDEATKTMTLKGEAEMTPGKKTQMRIVEKRLDKDTYLMEMYSTEPGSKEIKTMEIKYTRDKKVADGK